MSAFDSLDQSLRGSPRWMGGEPIAIVMERGELLNLLDGLERLESAVREAVEALDPEAEAGAGLGIEWPRNPQGGQGA